MSYYSNPVAPVPFTSREITRHNFPSNFVFGCATSAYQVEGAHTQGGRGLSIWDVYSNINPKNIRDGSNGNIAVDMYNRYKEDINMMKTMGFDAYRFSISWSRILPGGKLSLGVNQEGLDYYNDLINTIIDNGMKPYATLFHWDLPYLLESEYGGFLSEKIVDDFRDFAELCFWEFGDRVKHWITINEAWTYAAHGYANRTFPPGRNGFSGPKKKTESADESTLSRGRSSTIDTVKENVLKRIMEYDESHTTDEGTNVIPYRGSRVARQTSLTDEDGETVVLTELVDPPIVNDPDPARAKEAYTVGRNLLLSHAAAVRSYKQRFQKHQGGKIGMTNCIHWFVPYNDEKEEDRKAARRAFDFMLGWFLEPLLTGQFPKNMLIYAKDHIKPFSEKESALLREYSSDFTGINYYTTWYAQHGPDPKADEGYNKDMKVTFKHCRDGVHIGESTGSNWLYIVPWGFHALLKFLKDTFDNTTYKLPPIYITENGCDEQDNPKLTPYDASKDTHRVNYFRDHLQYLLKAITVDEVKVESYFAWSWCDNFEWYDGYNSRFGIFYIDFKNNLKRHRKESAMWFSRFLLKGPHVHQPLETDEEDKNKLK